MVFLELPLLERVRRIAELLGCPRLNLHGTGLEADGLPVRVAALGSGPG